MSSLCDYKTAVTHDNSHTMGRGSTPGKGPTVFSPLWRTHPARAPFQQLLLRIAGHSPQPTTVLHRASTGCSLQCFGTAADLNWTETWLVASVNIVTGDKTVAGAKETGEDKQVPGRAEGPHGRRLRGRQLKWLMLLIQWIFHRTLAVRNPWLMILSGNQCVKRLIFLRILRINQFFFVSRNTEWASFVC
jgi:hypothetical protein